MKIVQIAESLAVGDAVANDVVAIDQLLKEMDLCRGVFVSNRSNIHKRYLHNIAEPIDKLPKLEEEDVLLFHHAIANPFCDILPTLSCKKILIYHNITPPVFFENLHEEFRKATYEGLGQLIQLNKAFDLCIADSEFNKMDLLRMGYTCPICVCPVLVPFEDYKKVPSPRIMKEYGNDGFKNILFVGRLSPNKKQEDIIRTFALYQKYYCTKSRLILVGSDGVESYATALQRYVEECGARHVIITGSVPFLDILAYYSVADVFVCMSEHEGFCVPLVEAMLFDVPILAYDSCAVPWTLQGSGVLLRGKNFLLAAGWINALTSDEALRQQVIKGQQERLKDFAHDKVSNQLKEIITKFCESGPEFVGYGAMDSILDNVPSFGREPFFAVMPIKDTDWPVAKKNIPYILKNINPKAIIVLSSRSLMVNEPSSSRVIFLDENTLLPGLSYQNVQQIIKKAGGDDKVTGWYLQQFLKLGFSKICKDSYYLVWDADTLPINPITFFDTETGKPYFNLKREYVAPYFGTIKRLLNLDKSRNESFITEHMLFDTQLCKQMLDEMENNQKLKGTKFWEKCIYASDFPAHPQSFSEFETFGTYIDTKYHNAYVTRKLRTLRCASDFLGTNPSKEILDWVAEEFDTLSFEHWSAPINDSLSLVEKADVRKTSTFSEIIWKVVEDCAQNAQERGGEEEDLYRRLLLKMEFDYFFCDETMYEKGR